VTADILRGGSYIHTRQVLGGLLALAGVCPFVGSLADLLGRRYVALLGAVLLVVGTVVATTAQTMGQFIGQYLPYLLAFGTLISNSWYDYRWSRSWRC